jgi:drug/metabolite transporter (DMT)-like permease
MDSTTIGISAALGSAASWAIGSILFKKLGESLSPIAMTLAKGSVSVVLLTLVMLVTGTAAISTTHWALLIASGLVGIALGDTFFFAALRHLSPHTLTILLMFGQVFTVLLATIFLGERPTLIKWIGMLLVTVGIGVVCWEKSTVRSDWRGIVYGLLSVVCMSSSLILAKPALESTPSIQATLIRMLAGTLGMFVYGLYAQELRAWTQPFRDSFVGTTGDRQLCGRFVWAVLVVTFGGFWLSLLAMKNLEVWLASTLNGLEPIFVLPLAAIFLQEKIAKKALWGTAISIAGVVLVCR